MEEFFNALSVLSINILSQVNKFHGIMMALKELKTYIDMTAAIDEMLNQHDLEEAQRENAHR